MRRLGLAVLAATALATGAVGCVTFCDECDDFPSPNLGTSMMPGTYTGPAPTVGGSRAADGTPRLVDDEAPAASNAPDANPRTPSNNP